MTTKPYLELLLKAIGKGTWLHSATSIVLSKVTVCAIVALAVAGCASSSPRPNSLLAQTSPSGISLSATVSVQVTPPMKMPARFPDAGLFAGFPFAPPPDYCQSDTLCKAVRAALTKSALFSQVCESLPDNGDDTAIVLEVVFGDLKLGMKPFAGGGTVDFPSTWKLLTGRSRKIIIEQTIFAHGGSSSLSEKSVSRKAMESAVRDAISKGISSLSKQIQANIRAGDSLELLSHVSATAETKMAILRNVKTNSNPVSLQVALAKAVDSEIKSAAQLRLALVVLTSTNLSELIALCNKDSNLSVELKSSAREQAVNLLNGLRSEKDESAVDQLLLIGRDAKLKDNDLTFLSMRTAEDIVKATHEIISDEDYQRAFSSPEGGLLLPWVYTVRRQAGMGEGDGMASTTWDPNDKNVRRSFSTFANKQDGITTVTFTMDSLSYAFKKDDYTEIIREVVRRSSATSKQTVVTEVILFNGIRYRKSKIAAF